MRSESNRFAAAIAEGLYQGVPVAAFAAKIEATKDGIGGLASAWRKKKRAESRTPDAQKQQNDAREEFLRDDHPAEGHDGLVIAAVVIKDGAVTLRKVLENDPDKVEGIVGRYAAKVC